MRLVKVVMSLFVVLFFSSGCCETEYRLVKPKKPEIQEAKIEQCRYPDTISNVKCVLKNYFEVKEERDKLRMAIDEVTE